MGSPDIISPQSNGMMEAGNGQISVPPGFRFHPTDEELLYYYLRKKVSYEAIDLDVIMEVDLNKLEPWDLKGEIVEEKGVASNHRRSIPRIYEEDGWVVCRVFTKKMQNRSFQFHEAAQEEHLTSNSSTLFEPKQSFQPLYNCSTFDSSMHLPQLLSPESVVHPPFLSPAGTGSLNRIDVQCSQNLLRLTPNGCGGTGLIQQDRFTTDWSFLDKLLASHQGLEQSKCYPSSQAVDVNPSQVETKYLTGSKLYTLKEKEGLAKKSFDSRVFEILKKLNLMALSNKHDNVQSGNVYLKDNLRSSTRGRKATELINLNPYETDAPRFNSLVALQQTLPFDREAIFGKNFSEDDEFDRNIEVLPKMSIEDFEKFMKSDKESDPRKAVTSEV
ncbi:hypothetical protein RJ639_025046 [Escallonia herrerae]|uniref:NAC domain-containing protein n=1 Tax=Escallonia herrerae TaxID=1293975 RepID=A0AA88UXX9_9ASTE|nr:hypothetical protein RJ639_025046 [Escallonia herrerae]